MALSDNIFAYWDLDESSGNAIDAMGNYDLTDTNTVGTSAAGGPGGGRCRDWEADNSEYFTRASEAGLQLGDIDFTIAVWIKLETYSINEPFATGKWANSGQFEWVIRVWSEAFYFIVSNTGSNEVTAFENTPAPSLATWYLVECYHDNGTEIGIGVDGATPAGDGTTAHTLGVNTGTDALLLGRYAVHGTEFDGLGQYYGWWKQLFDNTERTNLFNSGSGMSYTDITGGAASVVVLRRRREEARRGEPVPEQEWRAMEAVGADLRAAARRDRSSFKHRKGWRRTANGIYVPDGRIVTACYFIGRAA